MKAINYSFPLEQNQKRDKVFYGTLTPTDWDEEDRPIEFSLYTFDEEDILLGSPHLKKKFLKMINQPVEVTGQKRTNDYGDEYLFVKKIKRIRRGESRFLSKMLAPHDALNTEEYLPLHHHSAHIEGLVRSSA